MFDGTEIDAKLTWKKGKMTCTFLNDMRNLATFHRLKASDFI